MNDITEVDRLNAEIADLKRTIEWYQGRTGIMMGAAAGAEIAAKAGDPPSQRAEFETCNKLKDFNFFRDSRGAYISAATRGGWKAWQARPAAVGAAGQEGGRDAGLEEVATLIDKKVADYDREHGNTDPDTGTREYPGDGAEWVGQMDELAEEIRALKSTAPVSVPQANAGPSQGDMPMDRFIAALPLPQYPVAAPAPTEQAGELARLIELLNAIKPNFGDVGSRDVEVRAQRERIEEAIAILSAASPSPAPAPTEPQWISVKDRLPTDNELVLVYAPNGPHDYPDDIRITFDCIDPNDDEASSWLNHNEHYEHFCCVAKPEGSIGPSAEAPYTHWMPIPAAPGASAK